MQWSDVMTKNQQLIDENFEKFLEKFGKDGFVQLFFTNYLYELLLYYLHSKGQGENDTSYSFYYNYSQKRTYTPEEIDEFKSNLRKECSKKAESIIDELKALNLTFDFTDPSENSKVAEIIGSAVKKILTQIEEDRGVSR